jgi:hypothetical protein
LEKKEQHNPKKSSIEKRIERIEFILDRYLWQIDSKAQEKWNNYFEDE